MNLRDEFFTVLDALTGAGVDHAVCGGFAVAIHGYERARGALRPAGYDVDGGMLVLDTGKPTEHRLWRVSKVEGEDMVTVDLLLAGGARLIEVWHGRERHVLDARELCVVSKAGLGLMKRAAGISTIWKGWAFPRLLMNPEEQKQRSRGISRDMSSAAISRRLEIVGQLREVWQLLSRARRIGPVESPAE